MLIGLHLPNFSSFGSFFVQQFIAGQKNLLPISAAGPVNLPNFQTTNLLSRSSLLNYIEAKESLKKFIPDSSNKQCLEREFLLQV